MDIINKSIEDYNESLINGYSECITIGEYFNNIHNMYANNMDISFMEYFLNLIKNNNKFIVKHEELINYGIIKYNKDTSKFLRYLNEKSFIKDRDYIITEKSIKNNRGSNIQKIYTLTPQAFKICLLSSRNESKYREYYILLETVHFNYNEYQKMYLSKMLKITKLKINELTTDNKIKSIKINTLEESNNELNKTNIVQKDKILTLEEKVEKSLKQNEELMSILKNTNNKADEIINHNLILEYKLDESLHSHAQIRLDNEITHAKLSKINNDTEIIKQSVNVPNQVSDKFTQIHATVYNAKNHTIEIISGQKYTVEKKIENLLFNDSNKILLNFEINPCPTDIRVYIMNELKNYIDIKSNYYRKILNDSTSNLDVERKRLMANKRNVKKLKLNHILENQKDNERERLINIYDEKIDNLKTQIKNHHDFYRKKINNLPTFKNNFIHLNGLSLDNYKDKILKISKSKQINVNVILDK